MPAQQPILSLLQITLWYVRCYNVSLRHHNHMDISQNIWCHIILSCMHNADREHLLQFSVCVFSMEGEIRNLFELSDYISFGSRCIVSYPHWVFLDDCYRKIMAVGCNFLSKTVAQAETNSGLLKVFCCCRYYSEKEPLLANYCHIGASVTLLPGTGWDFSKHKSQSCFMFGYFTN